MANIYQKGADSVYDNGGKTYYAGGPNAGKEYGSVTAPAAPTLPAGTSPAGTAGGNAAAAAAAAAAVTGNPIVDSGIRRHVTPDQTGTYAGTAASVYGGLDITPPTPTETQAMKDQALKDVQAQLDSIDKTYATKLADEKVRGENRVGQGRSLNARSGLLESDMGAQRAKGIDDVNKGAEDAIAAERENLKAAIFDKAAARAQDAITLETNKALKNADTYLAYLKQNQDSARADLGAMAKAGISLDQLSDEEYSTLLNQSGYNNEFLFSTIYNSQLPANQKKDYNYINAGNGIIVQVDPTGVAKPQSFNFSVPDGYEFKMAGDIPVFVNQATQDVKIALPGGDMTSAAQYAKETELDTYTNSAGNRVSVLYNPVSKTTRSIVLGKAKDETGAGAGGFPTGMKPQAFEVSAVSQYITAEGRKQGQTPAQISQALTLAQTNSSFFYSMLGTIVSDKRYSDLYYKPQTIGIPAPYVQNVTATPAGQ